MFDFITLQIFSGSQLNTMINSWNHKTSPKSAVRNSAKPVTY